MSALTRSKASRKRYAAKHHVHSEIAGRLVRHRKIKEKQIVSTTSTTISGSTKEVKRKRLRCVKAQIACHDAFDRLWQGPTQTMPRWRAYKYLQEIVGVSHIKYLNATQCKLVIMQVKSDFPQLFGVRRSWRFNQGI